MQSSYMIRAFPSLVLIFRNVLSYMPKTMPKRQIERSIIIIKTIWK